MYPYALIDLHCDTLTEWKYTRTGNPDTLDDPKRVLSLSGIPKEVKWAQFYAIFIPDEERGEKAIEYFDVNHKNFQRQMELFGDRVCHCRNVEDMESAWEKGKVATFLTVENGSVLNGDMSRIKLLFDLGVKCITIVWNGQNEIGSGHTTQKGLSDFGKAVIPEMENRGIIIDVSHLNDSGFEDLLKIAKKPFMATHSNARSICSHKRNLTDDMIREMVNRECLIGLNYFTKFLEDEGNVPDLNQLMKHIEHFIALGAGKNLSLGSDFDGATLPDCLNSPSKAAEIYGYFLERGMSKDIAEGIMFRNAMDFFKKNL